MKITYYSECDVDYVKAVKSCQSLDELRSIVTEYREIVEDAYQAVQKMDDTLFLQFCKGRNKSKPSQKWMEMYGAVLLPAIILEVGLKASQFHVPFGVVYLRLQELREQTKCEEVHQNLEQVKATPSKEREQG